MGRRPLLVLVGLVAALAVTVALRSAGTWSQRAIPAVAPAGTAVEAGETGGGPEEPGAYLAFRESSGNELTTQMFRRAKEQAAAIPASTASGNVSGLR